MRNTVTAIGFLAKSSTTMPLGVLVSYLAFGFCPHPASAQTDPPSARVDSLAAAADRGDAGAQYEYGRLFEVGADGIAIDYETAMEWYARAAEKDHIPARYSHYLRCFLAQTRMRPCG